MDDVLPAGQTINDIEIASLLGLSRTPVRDAIQRLRAEGFIEVVPRRGTRVAQITMDEMREVYQAITALEVEAAALAARRRPVDQELLPLRAAVNHMAASRLPGRPDAGDVKAWIDGDEAFHRGLLRLSGNRRIATIGEQLRDSVQRAHRVALRLRPIPVESERAHAMLIDLIAAGDEAGARAEHARQRRRGETGLMATVEKAGIKAL